jgi:CRISPR-associated protein Cas5d
MQLSNFSIRARARRNQYQSNAFFSPQICGNTRQLVMGDNAVKYGVRLHVWGDRACFTRPELKVERVSYDVITPSAARGILDAIHWKPAIRWIIDRLQVLKPIRFESIRRNEVGHKISQTSAQRAMDSGTIEDLALIVEDDRQQRAATLLKDVAYVIEAHFERTSRWSVDDSDGKHLDMFNRRAAQGQCFHRPCLGNREFPAYFEPAGPDTPHPIPDTRDLGLMLLDLDFTPRRNEPAIYDAKPRFFHAQMVEGIINVPRLDDPQVRA